MTIITKANVDRKNDKVEKPLVINNGKGSECYDHTVMDPASAEEVEAWLSSSSRRRVWTTTTVCFFLSAFLIMSIAVIGGVYIYRQFTRNQQMSRFHGWCGIPYKSDTLFPVSKNDHLIGSASDVYQENPDAEWSSASLFKEKFELDLDTDNYEEITVPDFGIGRESRFMHDFGTNKTLIIDVAANHCFVMPIDYTHILRPRSFLSLVSKMWMGYYKVDTDVIRQTMRVVHPRLRDLRPMGMHISVMCANVPTYLLEKIEPKPVLRKRSAELPDELNYIEFAGRNVLQITVIDHESQD